MIKLLMLLRGYFIFQAEGGFPERFINLCRMKGVNLRDVQNDGVKVKACTTEREYELVKSAAENSGMTLEIVKKRGMKFFAISHKWRFGAVLGVTLTILFWIFMSGFIWEVEVLENDGVMVDTFTESLESIGLKPGVRKSKIDVLEIQKQLMEDHKDILWVSVNIFGSKAQVEMSLAVKESKESDGKEPQNLVAKKNGTVTLVKGYKGENAVKEGETVVKGQLLISGITVNADGSENMVGARGEVFARTFTKKTFSVPVCTDVKITEAPKVNYSLYFFGLKIPFGKKSQGEFKSENCFRWCVKKTTLPLGIYREENVDFYEAEAELNEKEALLSALLKGVNNKREAFSDATVEKEKYSFKSDESKFIIISEIECVENIAEKNPIQITDE